VVIKRYFFFRLTLLKQVFLEVGKVIEVITEILVGLEFGSVNFLIEGWRIIIAGFLEDGVVLNIGRKFNFFEVFFAIFLVIPIQKVLNGKIFK